MVGIWKGALVMCGLLLAIHSVGWHVLATRLKLTSVRHQRRDRPDRLCMYVEVLTLHTVIL